MADKCVRGTSKVYDVSIRGRRCGCVVPGKGFKFRPHRSCGLTKEKASLSATQKARSKYWRQTKSGKWVKRSK